MLNTPQTTYVHTSHMSTTCTWFDFGTERQPFKIRIFRPILAAKAFKSQQLVRCISRWITPLSWTPLCVLDHNKYSCVCADSH